jgi:hypothetical protein
VLLQCHKAAFKQNHCKYNLYIILTVNLLPKKESYDCVIDCFRRVRGVWVYRSLQHKRKRMLTSRLQSRILINERLI